MFKKFQIHTIFRIPFRMEGLITLGKVILNRLEKSGVIYKLICKRCEVTYVGQTDRLLNTSVTSRDSTATSNKQIKKPIKGSRQHYSECDFIDASYRQIYRSIG